MKCTLVYIRCSISPYSQYQITRQVYTARTSAATPPRQLRTRQQCTWPSIAAGPQLPQTHTIQKQVHGRQSMPQQEAVHSMHHCIQICIQPLVLRRHRPASTSSANIELLKRSLKPIQSSTSLSYCHIQQCIMQLMVQLEAAYCAHHCIQTCMTDMQSTEANCQSADSTAALEPASTSSDQQTPCCSEYSLKPI